MNNKHEIKGMTYLDTDKKNFFVGPIAKDYNGHFTFGVSNKNIWKDVPKEYQGHYMAWDLILRYKYSLKSDKTQINNIIQQESLGLDRREMSWNWSDDYQKIVNKYGSDSSFLMAVEYDMVPTSVGPISTMGHALTSSAEETSVYFRNISIKGSKYFKRISVFSNNIKYSNNPWIRFLQINKGKYKGNKWLSKALSDYKKMQNN